MATSIYSIFGVLFATIFGALGAFYLKLGANNLRFKLKSIIRNKNLIIGIFFYLLSTFIFIPSLKFGELSVLYPLVSVTYIWVIFLSSKYLNEEINKYKWIGIATIIIGVILIGLG